ncbi:ac109 [Lambdina fiscellaria nucleopolyhedrovirus]|uniref:Ac109 n=1 Tax=Lambdina fiscellaria nucleopolyhedrovirus TaxID=1642929 RepID=A0A0E3Z603_9ABAC|nr:ac109 [Lambdina fiscellaria nucleopolyhedrovirus]AKC91673.1 ac109 [Lambdina fiscellaria nucleopolyhedrovirus]
MSTLCPHNIKVCISSRFFLFPYNYVVPQKDVGGSPVLKLVVYVPTEDDVLYVDRGKFPQFKSVLVMRHESSGEGETRIAKKNSSATVVYWNPIVSINEVGVGETRVFSVLLTNDLFVCRTIIVDHQTPMCPIEIKTPMNYKRFSAIEGEHPQFYLNKLMNDAMNDFLICFKRDTPTMVKILKIKIILCIFEYRKTPARYLVYLPYLEMDEIFKKLRYERVRRLMKGDVSKMCMYIDRRALQYVRLAVEVMGRSAHSNQVVSLVYQFQSLVTVYQMVPDIIVNLNSLENQKRVRLYCKRDGYAITVNGLVPINFPDINPVAFDYSHVNNSKHLYEKMSAITKDAAMSNRVTVMPAMYNYFF